MTFQEFTMKYRGGQKADGTPYLFPGDVGLVAAQAGLTKEQVTEWLAVWDTIQAAYVTSQNRMPTPAEIVSEYNRAHGIVEPVPVPVPQPVPVAPRDPAKCIASPFGLVRRAEKAPGVVVVAQMTVDQLEELVVHAVSEVLQLQPAQPKSDDLAAKKLAAVLEALKT